MAAGVRKRATKWKAPKQTAKQTAKSTQKETTKETVKRTQKQTPRGTARQSVKNPAKKTEKKTAKQAVKQMPGKRARKCSAKNVGDYNDNVDSSRKRMKAELGAELWSVKVKIKSVLCPQCHYRTSTQGDLSKHMLKHAASKTYVCTFPGCVYCTRYPGNLTKHVHAHSDVRAWACSECGAAFKTKSALTSHCLIHSTAKPLSCPLCPYRCKRQWELTCHRTTHVDNRPWACVMCVYRSKTKSDLHKHIGQVHVRPAERLKCGKCTRSFIHQSALAAHVRYMHTKRPRIKCDVCDKTFTSQGNMRKHMRAVHSRSAKVRHPFHCADCKRTFSNRHNLRAHSAVHSPDRTHQCRLCVYAAHHPWQLYAHVGSMHPGVRIHCCEVCHCDFAKVAQYRQHLLTRKHIANSRFALPPVDAEIVTQIKDSEDADSVDQVEDVKCEATDDDIKPDIAAHSLVELEVNSEPWLADTVVKDEPVVEGFETA